MVMITLRTDLNRIQRTNLETCITVHMHQKESTEDLMRKKVRWTCLALSPPASVRVFLSYSPLISLL
jgi:hypothetical protein